MRLELGESANGKANGSVLQRGIRHGLIALPSVRFAVTVLTPSGWSPSGCSTENRTCRRTYWI